MPCKRCSGWGNITHRDTQAVGWRCLTSCPGCITLGLPISSSILENTAGVIGLGHTRWIGKPHNVKSVNGAPVPRYLSKLESGVKKGSWLKLFWPGARFPRHTSGSIWGDLVPFWLTTYNCLVRHSASFLHLYDHQVDIAPPHCMGFHTWTILSPHIFLPLPEASRGRQ